jgi:hypothetical protein
LAGADLVNALASRGDLDLALIPAETINDSGVFLDDMSFDDLAAAAPMRVMASYDFLDVLLPKPAASGVSAELSAT